MNKTLKKEISKPEPKPQAPKKKEGLRPKHVPQRTCIACRSTDAKRELLRLVRTTDGSVEVDPSGKKAGRGAYLCKTQACWDKGLNKKALDFALKITIAPDVRQNLKEFGDTLPERGEIEVE